MAKKSTIVKLGKKQKYKTRNVNLCSLCGRTKAYMRLFGICRICFRERALKGEFPGVKKASW
jgi:small subunit ribosomal protein S14